METTLNSTINDYPVKLEAPESPLAPEPAEPPCCPFELPPLPLLSEPAVGDLAVALLGAFGIGTIIGSLLTYSFSRKGVQNA